MAPAPRRGRRIVVLCEGSTEKSAVPYFVARQWKAEGFGSVGLDHRNLRAQWEKVGPVAGNHLDEPDVVAVFTLIDLYGMTKVKHEPEDKLDAKVRRVQSWLKDQVTHARAADFHPHVTVHEVEAWILAEGTALARRLRDTSIKRDPQAEVKNFQKPPSERINDLFRPRRNRRYHKLNDGQPLFSKMEFQPVYESCRYFRAFYDDLKRVASQS